MKVLSKIKSILFSNWPIFAIIAINILLFIANYKPGTFLLGWDNLPSEFDPMMNIKRSIFAVWQEYQSLGLLGGMGHASDLVRQVYILLLTLILPLNLVRYVSTFSMLLIGSIGGYFLILSLLKANTTESLSKAKIVAFIGALFYNLNLATIQTFYAPFEAFTAHFAALPWVLLCAANFIKRANLKNTIILSLVLLLATPSAYIPTLFVVLLLSIGIFVISKLIFESDKKRTFVNSIKLLLIIIVVNAFWLLPFLFFTLQNSNINVNAKMNQMATESIFLQNKEFGTVEDTALLKGFWFNNVDPNLDGDLAFMLAPWRQHMENPIVSAMGYIIFGVILIGAAAIIFRFLKRKDGTKHTALPFVILFAFAFTMLATDTFPFSFFDEVFRKFPLFNQAFRFPFTKFSLLTGLTYSVMFAFGLDAILNLLKKVKLGSFAKHALSFIILAAFAAIIFTISQPAFAGNLFYEKERVKLPNEYLETFKYFKSAPQNARIANLPQVTFWGWTNYRWGYGGSGFLWYGIQQPILDRAFDVWSDKSENYYFELANALYAKDKNAVKNVLNKYQVSFILLDENVIYPASPKSLFYSETEALLSEIPEIKLDKTLGKIKIYKVTLADKTNSFVFTDGKLPNIQTQTRRTNDTAYQTNNNYISDLNPENQQEASFPLSLFSLKTGKEKDFALSESEDFIVLTKEINTKSNSKINIPNYFSFEKTVPFSIFAILNNGNTNLVGSVSLPQIKIDGKTLSAKTLTFPIAILPGDVSFPVNVNINGLSDIEIKKAPAKNGKIGTGFLTTLQTNSVVVTGSNTRSARTIDKEDFINAISSQETFDLKAGNHKIQILIPKINDSYLSLIPDLNKTAINDCDNFRFGETNFSTSNNSVNVDTTNDAGCFSFFSPNLFHDEAYAIFINNENKSGRPFHFWVLNEDQKTSPIDTYLDRGQNNQFFVLPSMEENGQAYSFHFDNLSIGRESTHNILSYFAVYPLPLKFLNNISVLNKPLVKSELKGAAVERVTHPNESLYEVDLTQTKNPATLVLAQVYDAGWHAYSIGNKDLLTQIAPFLTGKELKNHAEVNGWENGWIIEPDSNATNPTSIVIVYLPQYLEYLGFAVLIAFFLTLLGRSILKRRHSKSHPQTNN